MKVIIYKYYRLGEDYNWQVDERKEKEWTEEEWQEFKKYAGYTYSERYDELYCEHTDRVHMTLIRKGR